MAHSRLSIIFRTLPHVIVVGGIVGPPIQAIGTHTVYITVIFVVVDLANFINLVMSVELHVAVVDNIVVDVVVVVTCAHT